MESSNIVYPDFGALVISLDFERHWGVRDKKRVNGPYKAKLEGEWEAITKILKTFREFEIAATWATVGFLFADSREQMENHSPTLKPSYRNKRLYPYEEEVAHRRTTILSTMPQALLRWYESVPGKRSDLTPFHTTFVANPGKTVPRSVKTFKVPYRSHGRKASN